MQGVSGGVASVDFSPLSVSYLLCDHFDALEVREEGGGSAMHVGGQQVKSQCGHYVQFTGCPVRFWGLLDQR